MITDQAAGIGQACPNCGAIIDTADAAPLARIPCSACGAKVRVARTFDHFVLLESLGLGGLSTVYKARDTLLGRDVALKLLRSDLNAEIDLKSRLQDEVRIAAFIKHPNVVEIFSAGSDHGQTYLVMELLDHGSLEDKIEEHGRLLEKFMIQVAIQIAAGLRAAHGKGIVHRDVKPGNILFASERTARIGDFGLAGTAAEIANKRSTIWGTPYYVAPERLNNASEDFRSDIYSLGATFLHALTGREEVEIEMNSAAAFLDLKRQQTEDLKKVAAEISERTLYTLRRMLALDPNCRFSSYEKLIVELEQAAEA